MKTKLLLTLLLLLTGKISQCQDLKGVWNGYITARGLLNNSLYTLDIKTQKDNVITGKAYLYSNKVFVFQGIFDFIGNIEDERIKITELKILNQQMPDDKHYLCIKYESLTFSRDSLDHLKGTWGNSTGNCPPGQVVLHKATVLDTVQTPAIVYEKIKEDKSPNIQFFNTNLANPIVLNVRTNKIKIILKDYLNEDNDTVSVYFNRKKIIDKHEISNRAYSQNFKLDLLSGLNELVVFAENLGVFPPNTCTMYVDDGKSKQAVRIVSDKQHSAAIYLDYAPKANDEQIIYQSKEAIAEYH